MIGHRGGEAGRNSFSFRAEGVGWGYCRASVTFIIMFYGVNCILYKMYPQFIYLINLNRERRERRNTYSRRPRRLRCGPG